MNKCKNSWKLFLILSCFIAFFSSALAANIGDDLTKIAFGEYASFGGSTWRKARYYNHTTFDASEQGYFIRFYDDSYTGAYHGSSNVFATSTLASSTLPTFYTNMSNSNSIKDAVLETNWSTKDENGGGGPTWTGKVAIPSKCEVANNSEIFSTATPNWFWLRTPHASRSSYAWVAMSSASISDGNVNYTYRLVPCLRLSSSTTIISGQGNSGSPYILGYNTNVGPSLILTSSNTNINLEKDSNLVITGTMSDSDVGDNLVVRATIGGVEKVTSGVAATGSTQSWSLSWSFGELPHGEYSNIPFAVSDGKASGTAVYIGKINVDKQGPTCGAWTPQPNIWKNMGTTTFTLGETPDAGAAGVKPGKGGGTCTTGGAHGDTCSVVIEDNNDNTTTCVSPLNLIDKVAPTCGTWTPTESPWKISGGQEFILTNSTDGGGSSLATASATLSCTTGPVHGETCFVTIADQAGNKTICVSPINQVDIYPPALLVSPAIQGWQGDKQNIIITSSDDETSVVRTAYSWSMNNLGADCTGGNEVNSGDDLKFKIMGGENILYVCSVDRAGNVASFSDTYKYIPPVFAKPYLERQVTAPNMYWNILSVSETQSYVEVKGYFPKTTGSYNYEIELIIPTINKSYLQALQTSPYNEVHFNFIIPTVDFKASKDNHTFSGPQKLKITDLDKMDISTIDYNLTFFFPIHQINHRKDFNYFIFASDNRLNEVEE